MAIIVDTSVLIDHLRGEEAAVSDLRARRPLGATRRRRWWSMLQPVR